MNFQEVFKQLNGRSATTDDVNRFERMTAALETSPGDALLAVLVALDHYETLYTAIPEKINQTANATLEKFKTTAEETAAAVVASAKTDLLKTFTETAQKTIHDDSKKNSRKWVVGCVITVLLCVTGFGWFMHQTGYNSGYIVGYTKIQDETAAAAWGNSAEGRDARKLSQVTRISSFLNCSEPGWIIENGACFVKVASDGKLHGWKLP